MRFPHHRHFPRPPGLLAQGLILAWALLLSLPATFGAPLLTRPMKPAAELIAVQEPPRVSPRVLEKVTPENASILVSLGKQRAYLMAGGEIAIDTPVSSGKAAGMTPTGKYTVEQKEPEHRSNRYGNFVDDQGRVVRSGVSVQIDAAPSGTRFEMVPMKWFLRLNESLGIYAGPLPGYPASHGGIRLPVEIAAMLYDKVKAGTPVEIVP